MPQTRVLCPVVLLGIILLLSSTCKAQVESEFRLESITSEYIRIEQGLSQNSVNCLLQDSKGFLWVGTWSGLNRFDGYSFRIVTREYHKPLEGLTDPTVVGLVEDSLGYIWAATSKGLNRIDPSDFSVKQYTTDNSSELGLISDTIFSIYYDSLDFIWLGTAQGAFKMNPFTEEFVHYGHNPRDSRTLSDRYITSFHEDDSQNMWIGTRDGLNYLIRKTDQIIRYYGDSIPGYLNSSYITALEMCQEGYLWIGTPNGLNRLDHYTNWFEPYPLVNQESFLNSASNNYITSLLNDRNNELWVGTQEFGLYQFHKTSKQFRNLEFSLANAAMLNFNTILCIAEDQTGLFWIGTSHRGLAKLIPESHAFNRYLDGNPSYGIQEYPADTFWFGTQKGVFVFSKPLNRIISVIEHEYNKPNSLTNNRITNLLHDNEYMWIATKNGLNKYHIPSGNNTAFIPDGSGNSIIGGEVWGITKAQDGSFWFSTRSGLSHYFPETDLFVNFRHDPDNKNSISSNQCYQVMEMEANIFLIATQHGLNKYNATTDIWEVYLPIPGDLSSISSDYIFGIFEDRHNELWVYTNGGGINKFDPVSANFEHYTTENGLANNTVYGIIEDDNGFFWLPTSNGLSRFEPLEETFIKFVVQDGLPSNEFNFNGSYETRDGEIFMAGVNGITSFYPLSPFETMDPPSVQVTELLIHDEGDLNEMAINDQIVLNHDQNSFHISFAALDFLSPFKNRFEYFLENYDDSWNSLEMGVHQVEYRKLSPGDYSFRIRGASSLGLVNEKEISIRIIPAWWQTILFRILVISSSIIIIGLIIWIRYLIIHRRHEMEKQILTIKNELVQSQKFALRSQMNPHFIFNSLNSIQNFVLKNDVDGANYYLSNFSMLMRKVLEYSQYNLITLDDELKLIELYIKMEKLRFSNKFDVKIHVDPEIDVHMLKIPPMLLQPYLENAILHGLQLIKHRGLLKVMVIAAEKSMNIVIEDNGIGRKKANLIRQKYAHKSKGLKNIEKRIQLYNKINLQPIAVNIKDIFDNDNQPAGTQVTLNLPYQLDEPVS